MKRDTWILAGGLVAGAAIGIVAGMLLAPEKGSVTRSRITGKGEDLVDELADQLKEIVDEMNEKINAVRTGLAACAGEQNKQPDTSGKPA